MKIIEANRTADSKPLSTIVICVNERFGASSVSCGGSDSVAIADALEAELQSRNIVVEVDRIHCLGLCAKGPNVRFFPGGDWFNEVTVENVTEILDRFEAELNS
ncbi:MAG: (2Fe-2S) ferredoxin domain-containing protein [Alphaproteobacteria bacterium]|nr:(2Fe-2S) ferredoxin domain-containing protein [Alphaproteobacteria bacterium]MBT4084901.1 (2Fe-2S) ferredoxin domain-containing protein [Alphaproteobacteria bacterium]MBT4544092.1 (2Fe-2S) ferredoxin domain-containing protein [Alphaproteobacteria bacterium]MBT7747539.1 (2Fe-2S) ferredoxin domain-containing protein [Alphaproteobacteria bacterium]